MGGGYYSFESIPELIESGTLNESVLDTAVSRVLRAKFTLGLFEKPFPCCAPALLRAMSLVLTYILENLKLGLNLWILQKFLVQF